MHSIPILAFDIATSFDLTLLAPIAEQWGKVLAKDPVIVQLKTDTYVVVFDYGSIVSFNLTDDEARAWFKLLEPFASRMGRQQFSDNFILHVGERSSESSKEELSVPECTLDIVKLVAIVLSRSVSLEYYEELINRSLETLEDSVEQLAYKGTLVGNRKEFGRQVGIALNIQHELAYNLALLDDPDALWEGGPKIAKLYEQLTLTFEVPRRAQLLQRKLDIIAKSSEFILQRLYERTATRSEFAIIALFIIDVIIIFWDIVQRAN